MKVFKISGIEFNEMPWHNYTAQDMLDAVVLAAIKNRAGLLFEECLFNQVEIDISENVAFSKCKFDSASVFYTKKTPGASPTRFVDCEMNNSRLYVPPSRLAGNIDGEKNELCFDFLSAGDLNTKAAFSQYFWTDPVLFQYNGKNYAIRVEKNDELGLEYISQRCDGKIGFDLIDEDSADEHKSAFVHVCNFLMKKQALVWKR